MQFLYQKVEDQPPKELAYTIHTAARLRVENKELYDKYHLDYGTGSGRFNKAIAAAADMANDMKPSYIVGILFGTLWIAKHWPTNTNDVNKSPLLTGTASLPCKRSRFSIQPSPAMMHTAFTALILLIYSRQHQPLVRR